VSPNPLVGAVLVRDDIVVGEGYHAAFGGEHAEVAALSQAGDMARGSTVYVTLEPCAHHGKTPPCTDALVEAGVRRVVIATRDPHLLAAGGADVLREHGIDVVVGVCEQEARDLNAAFLHAATSPRPWVTQAGHLGRWSARRPHTKASWLTGPEARRSAPLARSSTPSAWAWGPCSPTIPP
jgi:diaminohydroxyphosphoribosylaminopyrimidine deaminase/5-amino-6-(5-phosphoribosylamino)uracil reductase